MGNESPEGAWLSAGTGKLFVNGQSHVMRTCAELENLPNDENENKATYGVNMIACFSFDNYDAGTKKMA